MQKVCKVLDKDGRLSIRWIAGECGIPKTIVHRVLTEDLPVTKVCVKMVPEVVTGKMMEECVLECEELHECYEMDPELFGQSDHMGQDVDILVQSLIKASEQRVAHHRVSSPERTSKDERIVNQGSAHWVF